MKAADVQMGVFYGPPSETNFGGALLTGSQSACKVLAVRLNKSFKISLTIR